MKPLFELGPLVATPCVNVNPETGIRYGIVAAHSLDPEIIDQMQREGTDVHYEEAKSDLWDAIKRTCSDSMSDRDSDDVADLAVERISDHWQDDEPTHEFELQGVEGRTTWLGGALLVWIFHSPFTDRFDLCSPCLPGACDLDSPNPDGYVGYTIPEDWKYHE